MIIRKSMQIYLQLLPLKQGNCQLLETFAQV
jgi:hypothetical protein